MALRAQGEDGRTLFRCPVAWCFEAYRHSQRTRKHFVTAHGRDVLARCRVCRKYFGGEQVLLEHMEAMHKNEQCGCCGARFGTKMELKQHMEETHLPARPYVCKVCKKTFGLKDALQGHVDSVHSAGRAECPVAGCATSLSDMAGLQEHMLQVHKRVACLWRGCKTTFTHRRGMMRHVRRVHEGRERRLCTWPDCGRGLVDSAALRQHVRMVHQAERFLCSWPDCKLSFASKQKMQLHVQSIHEGMRYACPVATCNKSYSSPQNVVPHIVRVHGADALLLPRPPPISFALRESAAAPPPVSAPQQERVACPFCGQWFGTQGALAAHAVTEHGPRVSTHLCLCGTLYETATGRMECAEGHLLTGEGAREMFACDSCIRVFTTRDRLARHVSSTHSRQRQTPPGAPVASAWPVGGEAAV